jgi:formyl-CoA transferase
MVATFPDAPGVGRDIRLVRTGFKLNSEAPSVTTPPPRLGEHTEQLLEELGYSPAQIKALQEEQVV